MPKTQPTYYVSIKTNTLFKTYNTCNTLYVWIKVNPDKQPVWQQCKLYNKASLPITLVQVTT